MYNQMPILGTISNFALRNQPFMKCRSYKKTCFEGYLDYVYLKFLESHLISLKKMVSVPSYT